MSGSSYWRPQDMTADTQQYFAHDPESLSREKAFRLDWKGRSFSFITDNGVFSKGELDTGTAVLLNALPESFSGRLLDLGCGWGPVGVLAGAGWPQARVTMADVNPRALALARRNAEQNGVRAEAVLSNGFDNLEGSFDLIALNPPIRAGKETVYRLFQEAAEHLSPNGALCIVIRKQQGAPSAQKYLSGLFHSVRTIARKGGYHVFQCEGSNHHAV